MPGHEILLRSQQPADLEAGRVHGGAAGDAVRCGRVVAGIYNVQLALAFVLIPSKYYFYFKGAAFESDKRQVRDRVGSVVANNRTPVTYYPYGQQVGTFAAGQHRFGTY